MPPLGNAVGFIDGQQADFYAAQVLAEGARSEALRREEKQGQCAIAQAVDDLGDFVIGEGGVDARRLDAATVQGLDLVFH